MQNCDNLTSLTHLYLQWNKIRKIENLSGLINLKKLYLGNNEITCLENVQSLCMLEELHIERQKIDSVAFNFDAISLLGISQKLRVLNISGLQLEQVDVLKALQRLREIIAADNLFRCAKEIADFANAMPCLERATFKGCPAQKLDVHYLKKITTGTDHLGGYCYCGSLLEQMIII